MGKAVSKGRDKETEFFLKKLELDYGQVKEKEVKKTARKIVWLKGWPEEKRAFWNGEAFMWGNKISGEKRDLIRQELRFLEKKGKRNLDLGCGSYSYILSMGFDISEKMLSLNERLKEKIRGDLEKKLPFGEEEFDSVTMVFVLDYIKGYGNLLKEVFRVLKKKGKLVVVQPALNVNKWQGQKKVNKLGLKEWEDTLVEKGFKVRFYEKGGLGFFRCSKGKTI